MDLIRVTRGEPDAEELAAVVTVLLMRRPSAGAEVTPATAGSRWGTSARPGVRRDWRGSALP